MLPFLLSFVRCFNGTNILLCYFIPFVTKVLLFWRPVGRGVLLAFCRKICCIAPGPERIRYLDINNLTEEDRDEYYIYQESFDKVYISEDWTDSFSNHISKPGKDHRTFTTQNTVGKLVRERFVSGKLARELERREIFPANQRRRVGIGGGWVLRPGKCTRPGKCSRIFI